MNAARVPNKWTESGKCTSTYEWETAPLPFFGAGKQATRMSLMQTRATKKGAPKQLSVCKLYVTCGVREGSLSGPKYIHRERDILSNICHPNIVRLEDFSYDPKGLQVAKLYLEYCPGGDLGQYLRSEVEDNRLSYQEGMQMLEQLSQALLYTHHGIFRVGDDIRLASPVADSTGPVAKSSQFQWVPVLHRDIKPANSQSRRSALSVG